MKPAGLANMLRAWPGRSSLFWHLLAWMLATMVLVWASFVVWGYQTGVHEADELTDGHLASVAALALNWGAHRALSGDEATPVQTLPGLRAHDYQESLGVALWNARGELIARTGAAPLPRFDLPQGFAMLGLGGQGVWRSFTQWNKEGTAKVTVMVALDERDSLAGDIAVQMITPGFWLLPVIVVALGIAIRRGLKPVNTLSQAVAQLDLSQDQRLPEKPALRELDPMVRSINTLLERQRQALARERNLANEVAHELRTPLASIALQAQALQSARGGDDEAGHNARQALQRIGKDALRAGHVLDQLLALARAERGLLDTPPRRVDWAEAARAVAAAQAQAAWQRNHRLSVAAPANLWAQGHAALLELALRNLVENAIRHTPPGTQIEVQAGRGETSVWMQVCDDGRRLGEPSAAAPADGLRLGHEIVARVLRAHGGHFQTAPAPEGFTTCYRMEIPLAAD